MNKAICNEGKENEYRQFMSSIIHELGNMMMLMDYSLANIGKEYPCLKDVNYYQYLVEDCNSMKELIMKSREYEKSIAINYEKINIRNIVDKIVCRYTCMAVEKEVSIQNDCGKNIFVCGDKFKLEQAIGNIVKNAIEELTECVDRERKITIKCIEEDGEVCISINNNGREMDEETIKNSFDYFYTSKKTGSGVGLAFCKKVIEAQKGKIEVVSDIKSGTTFMVRLNCNNVI